MDRAHAPRTVEDRCWTYMYYASLGCAAFNSVIYMVIHRWSTHPAPFFAFMQLSLPLLIWEVLLCLVFCPNEILEYYLSDYLIDPMDPELQRLITLRVAQAVHSAGDIVRGNRNFVVNTDTESEFLTASTRTFRSDF